MAPLFNRKAKMAPSHYPKVTFHAIRSFQFLASLVVGGIMIYFMYYLRHDGYTIPWTFIWLTAASLFSVIAQAFTLMFHCFTGLHPRTNLGINSGLLLLWALSWSLLTWFMRPTLENACDIEHWTEETGMFVCRTYKALFTFTLLGFVSTIAAFGLDIFVYRRNNQRGVYRLHDLDSKDRPEPTRGPFTDDNTTTSYANGGLAEPRESEAWEEPRPSYGPYDPHREQSSHDLAHSSNRFSLDTGYHGHGPEAQKLVDEDH